LSGYDPVWLDDLCLSGRIAWARLRPRSPRPDDTGRGVTPVRSTPITLLARRNAALWTLLSPASEGIEPSATARRVVEVIRQEGASFFDELVENSGLLKPQVEESLGELVALGLVTSDSFAGLRALLTPSASGSQRRRRAISFAMEGAGRWALARRQRPSDNSAKDAGEAAEHLARTLLRRYGVVFWRLIEREAAWLPPWRDLLRVYRRLEARGEIRGGRFVAGFAGEQFALPEAVGALRETRRKAHSGAFVSLSGADPLNLVGILTPGPRLSAVTVNRVLYRDGLPVALYAGGEVQFLETLPADEEWAARKTLLRGAMPSGAKAAAGGVK
jgi:ATP-dependent Lhr-like helicase